MREAALGFGVGVILTAGVFVGVARNQTREAEAQPGAMPQTARSPEASGESKWGSSPFGASPSTPTGTPEPQAPVAVISANLAADPVQAAAPEKIEVAPGSESDAAASNDAHEDTAAKVDAFLTDDFSRAIAEDRAHPRSPSQWHDDFMAEARNAAFADKGERQLADYFGHATARGVTLMGVQCRETLCEMKLTEPLGVPGQFRNVLDDWYQARRALGPSIWTATDGGNGQRYIVVVVRRFPRKP